MVAAQFDDIHIMKSMIIPEKNKKNKKIKINKIYTYIVVYSNNNNNNNLILR